MCVHCACNPFCDPVHGLLTGPGPGGAYLRPKPMVVPDAEVAVPVH